MPFSQNLLPKVLCDPVSILYIGTLIVKESLGNLHAPCTQPNIMVWPWCISRLSRQWSVVGNFHRRSPFCEWGSQWGEGKKKGRKVRTTATSGRREEHPIIDSSPSFHLFSAANVAWNGFGEIRTWEREGGGTKKGLYDHVDPSHSHHNDGFALRCLGFFGRFWRKLISSQNSSHFSCQNYIKKFYLVYTCHRIKIGSKAKNFLSELHWEWEPWLKV